MLTPTCTPALIGAGDTSTNAKNDIPKSNFFILFTPPRIAVFSYFPLLIPTDRNHNTPALQRFIMQFSVFLSMPF